MPGRVGHAWRGARSSGIYASVGVSHVWLVDPLVRTLEVHRLDGGTYRVVNVWRDSPAVRAEPFDAIELELGALWAD